MRWQKEWRHQGSSAPRPSTGRNAHLLPCKRLAAIVEIVFLQSGSGEGALALACGEQASLVDGRFDPFVRGGREAEAQCQTARREGISDAVPMVSSSILAFAKRYRAGSKEQYSSNHPIVRIRDKKRRCEWDNLQPQGDIPSRRNDDLEKRRNSVVQAESYALR